MQTVLRDGAGFVTATASGSWQAKGHNTAFGPPPTTERRANVVGRRDGLVGQDGYNGLNAHGQGPQRPHIPRWRIARLNAHRRARLNDPRRWSVGGAARSPQRGGVGTSFRSVRSFDDTCAKAAAVIQLDRSRARRASTHK